MVPARAAAWLLAGALVATACSPGTLAVPDRATPGPAALPGDPSGTAGPEGTVRVAYPAPPSAFLRPVGEEPAVDDLAALWGLPLFRLGPEGQLRRGLVADWEVVGPTDAGWEVMLDLRDGDWSDGSQVDGDDVRASLERRIRQDPGTFGVLSAVEVADDGRVRLLFESAYAGWSDLLLEAGSMLPADALDDAADTYAEDVPVSGGPFHLAEQDPGRRLVFEAHAEGPLGPPGLARLVVLFVPSFETALGLLDSGEVEAVLGHLALNPVARAEGIAGVEAGAPVGGTTVALRFRDDGALGGERATGTRRGLARSVDVGELVEGLLGPFGEVAESPWPGGEVGAAPPPGELEQDLTLTLVHPRDDEALVFTARSVQRDLRGRDVTVELVPEPSPRFAETVETSYDAALQVRRTGPRPSLVPWVEDVAVARQAAAAETGAPAARDGVTAAVAEARYAPLYRVGVSHAWRDVEGIRPSSWLGAGFWNVGEWHRDP